MNLQEAQGIVETYLHRPMFSSTFIPRNRRYINTNPNDKNNGLGRPDVRELWHQVYYEMSIHLDGIFPYYLIGSRRPYEDDNIAQYRFDNYEPVTVSVLHEAIDGLYTLFNSSHYDLELSPSLAEYVWGQNFKGMDFVSYIQDIVLINMLRDPNGVLVILPDGDGLIDPAEPITPKVKCISSYDVIHNDYNVLIYQSEEKSKVLGENGQMSDEGRVVYIIDKETIFKAIQTGNVTQNNFEVFELYRHDFGMIPAITLGGIWNPRGYYESYFRPCIPYANECIRQYSDLQAILTTSAFPIREIMKMRCTAEGCQGGQIYHHQSDFVTCPKCKGTGTASAMSPYGVIEREPYNNALALGDPTAANQDAIKFYSPDVSILQYAREAYEMQYKKLRTALHLEYVNEAQSGNAKAMDKEGLYSFMSKLSDNVFDSLMFKALDAMERYINPQSYIAPVIIKPTTFHFRSEGDLYMELNALKTNNASEALTNEVSKDLIKRKYSGNPITLRSHDFMQSVDPLYFKSQSDKAGLLSLQVITDVEMLFSMKLPLVLDNIISERDAAGLDPLAVFDDPAQLLADIMLRMNPTSVDPLSVGIIESNNPPDAAALGE